MILNISRQATAKLGCILLFLLLLNHSGHAADLQLGKQIYEHGILPNGRLLNATIQGDIRVKGDIVNCASCHRRSGYGDSEGGNYVPPITGPILFNDYLAERQHLFRNLYQDFQRPSTRAHVRDRKHRTSYNQSSLQRALTQGLNSNGEPLSLQMPRFELNNEELKHLASYLETLGQDDDESLHTKGVDSNVIHFATIYTPQAEPDKVKAVQAVFDAYLKRRNLNVVAAKKKPGYSAGYKSDFVYAQRSWQLHQWHLHGAADSWPKQLADFYAKQPVFAVLGGIGNDWIPMHRFCEANQLPCLFPNTSLPVLSEAGRYSLYLSRGLQGEALGLSEWLTGRSEVTSISQIYRSGSLGHQAGQFLEKELSKTDNKPALYNHVIASDEKIDEPVWNTIASIPVSEAIVLWLNQDDLNDLPNFQQTNIIASASLLDLRNQSIKVSTKFRDLRLIWPWALPNAEPKRLYRARAWMRSRRVALTHELEQLNTFFALNLADYAIHDLIDRFSRDYFIEIVERNTENTLNPGLYTRMSLGPEQRIAVRDYSIIRLSELRATPP